MQKYITYRVNITFLLLVSSSFALVMYSSLNCDFKSLFTSKSRRALEILASNWSGSAPPLLIIFAFVVNIWNNFEVRAENLQDYKHRRGKLVYCLLYSLRFLRFNAKINFKVTVNYFVDIRRNSIQKVNGQLDNIRHNPVIRPNIKEILLTLYIIILEISHMM